MRKSTRALALLSILLGAAGCVSADTTWYFNDVTFSDGATVVGYFTMNSTLDGLTDWNANVVGSNLPAPSSNFHYVPANSDYYYISPVQIQVASDPFAEFMRLIFDSPITNAGGTIGITPASASVQSVDCSSVGPCGGLLTGSITTSVGIAPEPDSLGLAVSVLALFFVVLRLVRRQEQGSSELSHSAKIAKLSQTATRS